MHADTLDFNDVVVRFEQTIDRRWAELEATWRRYMFATITGNGVAVAIALLVG